MKFLKRRAKLNRANAAIARQAQKQNVSEEAVSIAAIESDKPRIAKYVASAGLTPAENPVALAVQAQQVHDKEVWDTAAQTGAQSYEEAENQVFEKEENLIEQGYDEDEFLGAIIGAVGKVAKKGRDIINKKRVAKGKKPILTGAGVKKLIAGKKGKVAAAAAAVGANDAEAEAADTAGTPARIAKETGAPETAVATGVGRIDTQGKSAAVLAAELIDKWSSGTSDMGQLGKSIMDEIEKIKTKKAIKKYMPYAIGGGLLLVGVGFFIGKSMAKKSS